MLYSMTGFGRAMAQDGEQLRVQVQLRSVNHRGLDVRCVLPSTLAHLELEIVQQLREATGRGRIEARVELEGLVGQTPSVDRAVAREVHRRLEALRVELGLSAPVGLEALLRAPGIWTLREAALDASADALVRSAVSAAIAALNESRASEGAALLADLGARLERLAGQLEEARVRAPQRIAGQRERMRARVAELRAELGGAGLDESRLATELALMAERADVDEELHRAAAHLEALGGLLGAARDGAAVVGKQLDFFLQELGREINTLGSKSRDAELSHLVIEMKTELESMREQTANVQ